MNRDERLSMKHFFTAAMIICLLASHALGGEKKLVSPEAKDKCPVCGMFVAKYPDFMARIIFKDGTYALFDGAKDMFKYYFNLAKYNPSKQVADIDAVYVTDYYQLSPVDGLDAYYVLESDVLGPMGRELIPFQKEDDAREFMVDHAGKSLVRWNGVTQDLIKGLD